MPRLIARSTMRDRSDPYLPWSRATRRRHTSSDLRDFFLIPPRFTCDRPPNEPTRMDQTTRDPQLAQIYPFSRLRVYGEVSSVRKLIRTLPERLTCRRSGYIARGNVAKALVFDVTQAALRFAFVY